MRLQLLLAAVSTLALVAGVVVALAVTDTIVIQSQVSTEFVTETEPARTVTVTETVRRRASSPPPIATEAVGDCSREPNEDRVSAVPIAIGTCSAAIETQNDRDWYRFESPGGGQFRLTVQKAETAEEGGTIIATLYDDAGRIESEHVAADEPLTISYTLAPGSELVLELVDGCSPGGCGVGGYSFELEAL